ncbi:hypothetical protein [Demequina sp. NBRC 110053]|uniref:hypothetical protein n=1 Tax=Demequina sp. NBRC 110053 TaxID=1570342 RepID=UPI000A06DB4D|nr:hypothetical protein [Demequina sp. NBRC 110053]
MTQPAPAQQSWKPVIGLAIGLSALLSTMLIAFGLPAVTSGPSDVPIAIAAPEVVVDQITDALDDAQPGAFDVTVAPDEAAATAMILDRDIYGAFVVGPDGLTVDIASAASPAIAQLVTAVGQDAGAQLGADVVVNDIVPTSEDDPNAVGLSAGALPIALGGFIAGVATTLLVQGTGRRLAAVSAFAVIAGLAMTAILQFWFGTFTGSFWATAAAAMLGIVATSATVLGLESLLGRPGIVIAALAVVFLGNPLSGIATGPEMLPTPWGAIGQFLPPGATGTLLRNVAFFDGAAIGQPVAVLLCWLALGATLLVVSGLRPRRVAQPAVA